MKIMRDTDSKYIRFRDIDAGVVFKISDSSSFGGYYMGMKMPIKCIGDARAHNVINLETGCTSFKHNSVRITTFEAAEITLNDPTNRIKADD